MTDVAGTLARNRRRLNEVTAASVITGAQLISRRTEPLLGPVSAPGLVAVGVGGLAWLRLVVKRRAKGSWFGRATKAVQLAQDIRPRSRGPQDAGSGSGVTVGGAH
jgi:hypothetical protein